MRRLSASFVPALAVAVTVTLGARPGLAAIEPAMSFDQLAKAWMGAVALLAHDDGEREHGDRGHGGGRHRERGDRDHGNREHARGDHEHGHHGHGAHEHRRQAHGDHGSHGPRVGAEGARAVNAKMDEILARLARIEAKLDGRAGGPPRIERRGPWPPAGGPGPRPWAGAGPRVEGRSEIPEEVREQMRKRMEEGRDRMDQARQAFRQMEDRIKKLEAEIERLKADR